MNDQEEKAIKWIKNVRDDAMVTLDHIIKNEPNVSPMLYAGRKEKAEVIIACFEELEQYRVLDDKLQCEVGITIKELCEEWNVMLAEYNNGWIPVSEKLPEEGEDVLVWYEYFRYGEYNRMYQTYGIGYQFDGRWGGDVSGCKARCIAWQPLPEPYQTNICDASDCPFNEGKECPAAEGCAGYEPKGE